MTVLYAQNVMRHMLEEIPDRLGHSRAVGDRVRQICDVLDDVLPPSVIQVDLIAAAYLHDVGYSELARETGLHQLDGARWIAQHIPGSGHIARFVANHTCAQFEARERNLHYLLAREFPPVSQDFPGDADQLSAIFTYADMTTGPDGSSLSIDQRFTDIYRRYEAGSIVESAIRKAETTIRKDVQIVNNLLAKTQN